MTYVFSAITIKIPIILYRQKHSEIHIACHVNSQNNLNKEKQSWRPHSLDFKMYLQRYSN